MKLMKDVHLDLLLPDINSKPNLICGSYDYYHYLCDGINDVGWGCGYRTLQTMCSWVEEQKKPSNVVHTCKIPSIQEIQSVLVKIGDKDETFINSREWIGSVEVAYVLDHIYDVQCKILHCRCIEDLVNQINSITNHFKEYGSPIMMGGDRDCSSKGILGICEAEDSIYFLILDPHFHGKEISREKLQQDGWIKWQNINTLDQSSFYNLCCPLIKGTAS